MCVEGESESEGIFNFRAQNISGLVSFIWENDEIGFSKCFVS